MRRIAALVGTLALACGGSGGPSGPGEPPEEIGSPQLSVVAGDSQQVLVTDTLPSAVEVCATRGEDPVTSQLMDWQVLEEDAGKPFVTTTKTGSEGCTRNRVIAETRAHTSPVLDGHAHIEVKWVDQESGEAVVEKTVAYLVMPGEAAALQLERTEPPRLGIGDSLDLLNVEHPAEDQYGNPIPRSDLRELALSWEFRGIDGRGPKGSGSVVESIPELHRFGWHYMDIVTVDTAAMADCDTLCQDWPSDTIGVDGRISVESESGMKDRVDLTVRLPTCWQEDFETRENNESEPSLSFHAVSWTEGCTQPWEDW